MSPTAIVAYVVLFAGAAFAFIFAALVIGRLVRPKAPGRAKREIYECGEPTVGSGFVQFDLRFYVVALLFIVFDVEAAFFFPWAVVFGTSARMSDPAAATAVATELASQNPGQAEAPQPAPAGLSRLGLSRSELVPPGAGVPENARAIQNGFGSLALMAMADMAVFFGVLLVGFAYVWKQGDLNWVRAIGEPKTAGATDAMLDATMETETASEAIARG